MGRRPLKGGAVRLLGVHGGVIGRAFRRGYDALDQEFDLSTPLLRLEASRTALAWANLEVASRALQEARHKRLTGLGRRPSPRDLERATRRQGLADNSYAQAFDRLRALASTRKPLTLVEAIAQRKAGA